MTDGIRTTMRDMTGQDVPGCPWSAFHDPFVAAVIHAVRFMESGNLSVSLVEPSHRLIEGIGFWQTIYNSMSGKQMELDRKNKTTQAPVPDGLPVDRFGARRGKR